MLIKDTMRAIKNNVSRYISILLIVALGTAFYAGIKATAPDMFLTAEEYFTEYNLMDIRVQSALGLTENDLTALTQVNGVEYAAGQKFADALVRVNGNIESDIDGTQISTRAYSISPADISNYVNGVNDGSYINRVQLIEGRYPSAVNECLVDASDLSTPESFVLGSTITLENEGGSIPSELNTAEFTVVGIIRSPFYVSFERGNTDIGSGKVGTFIVIPEEAFNTDYYTEIYLKIAGADAYEPFSDEYAEYVDSYITAVKAVSGSLIQARRTELRPQLLKEIEDGEKEIRDKSNEATLSMQELDSTIAQLQELVANGDAVIAQAQQEYNERFSAAEGEISTNTEQYNAAILLYKEKKDLVDKNQAEYDQKYTEYVDAKELYDQVASQANEASGSINTLRLAVSTTNDLISAAEAILTRLSDAQVGAYSNEQIQSIVTMMQTTYPDLYNSVKALTTGGLAGEIVTEIQPYLADQKEKLAQQEEQITQAQELLEQTQVQLEAKNLELTAALSELTAAKTMLENAKSELADYYAELTAAGYSIKSGELELEIERMQAQSQLKELIEQVNSAPLTLETAIEKRAEADAQLTSSLSFAQSQLDAAKALYEKIDLVSWNIYDRDDTPGYSGYGQSVKNIEMLSNIFPVFFFLLASLICLTTMTRLIEEDRVLIGTYKALGYTNGAITGKYIIYSLSACIIGTVIGVSIGVFLFPYAINGAYSIMYSMPPLEFEFPWIQAAIGFGVSVLFTSVVTIIAILRELKRSPAVLMRPKAPKAGKRILLEKITFVWRRLSFTSKVTMRNLFRNRARFFMTMVGIAGCSALMLASLGMYNSISAIVSRQYGENAISKYDFQIVFDNAQTTGTHTAEYNNAASDARIEALCLTSMKSMTGFSDKNDKKLDVYLLVPENPAELNNFVELTNRLTGESYTLDDNGAIITEKLARDTGTAVGDTISFSSAEGNVYSVKVSAIAENYAFHYIYMSEPLYRAVTGTEPVYSYAVGKISASLKTGDETADANIRGLLATDMVKTEGITAIAYTSDTTESIKEITQALSLVILVFFISALLLAFVVLYNLSNINIIERTRELATLKVLGFFNKEVDKYIYRENIFVSVFGILFGVLLGIGLHFLLITFTAIDAVMYGQSIAWYSYVIAIALTIAFIAAVNLLMHKKLKKIDMVLSLKSVE